MKKGVNGCGCGSGILKYFKPPYAKFFESYCNAHDMAYDTGGDKQDRKHADRWLYRQMIGCVYACDFNAIKTTWLVIIALLYYVKC
jgi:hypothetical protein